MPPPNTLKKRIRSSESFVDTPQFPGWQKGMTQKQVQDFIKDQVRRKGFTFSGGTTSQDFPIVISGNARFLFGIAFVNAFGTASFKINNEEVIEDVALRFMQFGATNQDYYAINRPLSGSDDVTLTLTGFAGYTNEQMVLIYK